MAYFLMTMAHGPARDPARSRRAQDGFDQHAAFLDSLVDQGVILLGGPLGEDVDTSDALLLIRAADEAGARAVLAGDPWLGTVLTIRSVQRWTLWLRGQLP
ncbi:MAG TPA: YciI family protein [Streptosporangiaceae bacterium]|jgi:uncharacterized protein YciI